jgi:hypothetical protein
VKAFTVFWVGLLTHSGRNCPKYKIWSVQLASREKIFRVGGVTLEMNVLYFSGELKVLDFKPKG